MVHNIISVMIVFRAGYRFEGLRGEGRVHNCH